MKRHSFLWFNLFLFIVFVDYNWMMDGWHMMDWGGIQFMGFWMIGFWLILFVIAVIVHKDAEKHGMDGLIWFILIIIPVIGYIFLIIYLILRNEKNSWKRRTSSQEILDERYAKGEITREEYQQKKEDIKTRK